MDTNKTAPAAEPTEEELKELANALPLQLWVEWVKGLEGSGEDQKAPAKMFAEVSGVAPDSPIAFMYLAFYGGLNKGLELASKIG